MTKKDNYNWGYYINDQLSIENLEYQNNFKKNYLNMMRANQMRKIKNIYNKSKAMIVNKEKNDFIDNNKQNYIDFHLEQIVNDKIDSDIPAIYEIYKNPTEVSDKCNASNIVIKEIIPKENNNELETNNLNNLNNLNYLNDVEYLETLEVNKKYFDLLKNEEEIKEKIKYIDSIQKELENLKDSCICSRLENETVSDDEIYLKRIKIDKLNLLYNKLLEELEEV